MALAAGQAVLIQGLQIRVRIKLLDGVDALGGPLAGQQHQGTAHGHLKMNGDTMTVCNAYKAVQRGEA